MLPGTPDSAPPEVCHALVLTRWLDRLAPPILVLVAMVMTWWLTGRAGPHLSPDSLQYLAVAEHVRSGHGFTSYDLRAMQVWPPAYPLLLAGVGLVVGSSHLLGIAQALGIVLAGVASWLAWLLARRHLGAAGATVVTLSFVLGRGGITATTTWVWSDPLLIVAILALILLLESAVAGNTTRWRVLAAAGAAASLASCTSYAGLQVAAAGALVLLVAGRVGWGERVRRIGLYGVIVAVPIGAWMVRNLLTSGDPAGPRVPSVYNFSELMDVTGQLATGIVIPGLYGRPGLTVLFAILTVTALMACLALYRRRRAGTAPSDLPSLVPLATVSIVSFVVVLASALQVWVSMDPRTFSRLAFPLVVLGAAMFRRALAPWWRNRGPVAVRAASVGLLLLLGLWLTIDLRNVAQTAREPRRDYSADSWRARIAKIAPLLPADASVWSNQPDVVWYYSGRTTYLLPQQEVLFDPRPLSEQLQAFRESVASSPGGAVLVGFDRAGLSSFEPATGVLNSPVDLFLGHRVTTIEKRDHWMIVQIRPESSG